MPNNELLELYDDIKLILESKNIRVFEYKLIDYGLQFNISVSDYLGMIRIYQNKKKELKVDYSQLKKPYAARIQELIENKRTNIKSEIISIKVAESDYPIIGTDESGKGDYFGPLVSAGVYVDEESAKDLIALGVKDSKKLSDSKNLEMASMIKTICKGNYSIIEISPEKYNMLYAEFKEEQKNLNILLAWSHSKAIEEILSKVNCKNAIIDQFADEKIILRKLQDRGRTLTLIQRHKAEDNIAVAAASIIARAKFLESLAKLSNKYKIDLPKGASERTTKTAKIFVSKYGLNSLGRVAKIHFKITDQVFNKNSTQ